MIVRFVLAAALCSLAQAAPAQTLDAVRDRGELRCGVSTGTPGMSEQDAAGAWSGFDVSFCRAVAAAIFGDPDRVAFVPTTAAERFKVLRGGEADLLARATTWTFAHDVGERVSFVGVSYMDGQGFMAPRSSAVTTARRIDGHTICVHAGTTSALNLADFLGAEGLTATVLEVEGSAEAQARYAAGDCQVYTADVTALAGARSRLATPRDHLILSDIISSEPLGPVVPEGDDAWADLVRWVLNAMILAEHHGVGAERVRLRAAAPGSEAEMNRLLGLDGDYGAMLGLSRDWAVNVIAGAGNYGEVFDATLGAGSRIGLPRGLNAPYAQGGLLFSPPFR